MNLKLVQIFTALVAMTLMRGVQADWCYCGDKRRDVMLGDTNCMDVKGTRTLHHVLFGDDIYCDVGHDVVRFESCCRYVDLEWRALCSMW
ncbi:hypothetical protein CPB85DRAFT_1303163 [Mucidula mucida]|nr:hypothetical protein CPB85DRAFT_1303163 [Mucidula mucida]